MTIIMALLAPLTRDDSLGSSPSRRKNPYNRVANGQTSGVSSDSKGATSLIQKIEERRTSTSSISSSPVLQILFESYELRSLATLTDVCMKLGQ